MKKIPLTSKHRPFRFNWQSKNHFQLLYDGPSFFKSMLDDISQANNFILLEMYWVESGYVSKKFVEALSKAASKKVKVYILLDAFGSRDLNVVEQNQLISSGVKLCFYNPLKLSEHKLALFRDHRKLLIVDGLTAYVGGAGLSDEFEQELQPEANWRENMVKIQGDNVQQWQQLFTDNWQKWSNIALAIPTHANWPATFKHGNFQHKGRVTMTSGPDFLEIKRSFINHVRHANKCVWISTAYFAPSRSLRKTLCRSARRGIDVRILIPGSITDNPMARYNGQRYYTRFLKAGIRFFEYQPRFLHAKLVLCDNWVSLGSCNLDRWNFRWNLDANQEIEDDTFSASVIDVIKKDFDESKEITLEDWKKISFFHKLKISFWSLFIRGLDSSLLRLKLLNNWRKIRHRSKKRD